MLTLRTLARSCLVENSKPSGGFRKDGFMYRYLLVSVWAAFVLVPPISSAGPCYSTIENQIECSGPGGCHEPFIIDFCEEDEFGDGDFCITGYGLC